MGGVSDDNTIIGYQAATNGTGDDNTLIGSQAGSTQTTADGTIKIGYQAGQNDNTSNVLFIDNSNDATPLIWGDFSTDSLIFNGAVTFGSDVSSTYGNLSATDKLYQDTHLGAQNLNATVYSPGLSEHGGVVTYDSNGYYNGTDEYVITDVVSVESAAGMMVVAFDTIDYTQDASQENIVELPVGAVVWDIQIHMYTEFDGGGTNLLDIGITGDGDQ